MKIKFTLALILFCFISISTLAQTKKKDSNLRITSKDYLERLVKEGASNDYTITGEHISSISGIKHTYIRQAINGLQVLGTESSIHTAVDGSTLMAHVNFVSDIAATVKNSTASLSAEQAITGVAQQMGYTISNLEVVEVAKGINQNIIFNKAGISSSDIPVKKAYYYQDGVGTRMIWELSIEETDSADWWNFRVDAATGSIIDKDNWTVQCSGGENHNHHNHDGLAMVPAKNEVKEIHEVTIPMGPVNEESMLVGSYRVYAFPFESPYFTGHTLQGNPDDATASPFGWHDTNGAAGAEWTSTKGNNVDAYDDAAGDNTASAADRTNQSAAGLVFDHAVQLVDGNGYPIYTNAQQSTAAATVNVFYWSNIIHDAMYQYGFNEAAGNFQENNYGNGGAGSDSVNAEAQDGSGTCNANFGTPGDGGNPRMQMYICDNNGNGQFNDGDYDNLVIIHEYGHGISNRLTGGPSVSNGLQNTEQMGEGWSDFYGYMLTMTPSNFSSDRTTGTFLFEQGSGGGGIRNAPYSTSLSTNPWTYSGVANTGQISQPHGIGFIWASMLYEMTQALITQYGFDPDIYNGSGGNNIALQLVTEGLKLQPTSPGFVDGRDAILAADLALNGGANECLIWTAFAKRGLGFSASQGSTNSRTDGVQAFDLPAATFSVNQDTFCETEGVISGLTGGRLYGGVYTGPGVTDDGNGFTFTFDATAAGIGAHVITYTDSCRATPTTATDTITVTDGIPVLVCQDITITLDGAGNASILNADVIANIPVDTSEYTVETNGTFNQIDISGTATTVSLPEDNSSGILPLGFDFSFFGNTYSNYYLQSNGFLSFDNSGVTGAPSWTPIAIPNTSGPNNMISFLWDDMSPQEAPGVVRYANVGTAPNRILVVDYINVRRYTGNGTGAQVTTQLQLFEGSNRIEVHTAASPGTTPNKTQGIENMDGTAGYFAPGRNGQSFEITSNDVVAFVPVPNQNLPENCGNPVSISLSQSSFTCKDVGVNNITVTADDGNGGISTCIATVTVEGDPTTFSAGSWDNGAPTLGSSARFSASYDMNNASNPSIDACSCEIDSGTTVTVGPGDYLNVDGNITVNGTGSLIVNHTGSVVQNDSDATVFKDVNATIEVELTTPVLSNRDFMVMGSPMDGETRNAVFTDAFLVLNNTPANFYPLAGVPVGGTNFVDDKNTNGKWVAAYAGAINPGEGYIVRPQTGYGDPAVTSYDMTYTLGTLNNGDVDMPLTYNGPTDNPTGTPHLLSNPYASPINSIALINDNPLINEVYFWEHLTPPSTSLPGSNNMNFDMDDLSMRNASMALPAPNDPGTSTTPNGVISTGQGFAVKAQGAGFLSFTNSMRLTSGNTTLRNNEELINKLTLEVRNAEYGVGSYSGLAFNPNATEGLDDRLDTQRLATIVSLFSHLQNGTEQLGIQTMPEFENGMKIPFGFTTQVPAELEFVISIAQREGIELENTNVYLIDNLLGTITNLTQTGYSFKSDKQTYEGRFTLQFEAEVLGVHDVFSSSVAFYPNPTEDILNIVSPKADVNKVAVHDIAGRKIREITYSNEIQITLDLSQVDAAIYFVTVTTNRGAVTKRVIKK